MSARTHKHNRNQTQSLSSSAKQKNATPLHPALARVANLLRRRDYQAAAELLRSAGREPSVRNTLGVCLLRLGHVEEALSVFRQFVLTPGSVTERSDVSNVCKRNFAVALLMKGSPSGALDVINETREPDHPMAIRVREAVKTWERSLSWLRRIDWKLNRIEPPRCQVPIDFEPGEFEFEFESDIVQRQFDKPSDSSLELAV
ncbi:hypothetical protein RMSM_07147 [Rhodopirellula maiorica SM1]|uniref:Tetratricopeptide repeat protein n=1 Tax=Rhodopirellula maiorica SM1 TaxID=1265738 RepID=M5RPN5_9BACT|nr:hypothetical protein [Rhodopirellula maiorica]EMI15929.1 hypothetical protein RMSM_07147 [Rhodopirellula maiorica SM1]